MAEVWIFLRSPRAKAGGIAALIVILAFLSWYAPPHAYEWHNILHHLNFLPFMMAGMLFGWRGALLALIFAVLIHVPGVTRHWKTNPLDAQDQLVELGVFGAAGVIAGLLSDRERVQRQKVEATKLELELVYNELRQNIKHLKKTERLTAAGQLAASLAHEIRNPLASISGAAGILKRGQAPEENRLECLSILDKESQRLNKLLTNFLDFARPRLPRYQRMHPASLIESVAVLARHAAVTGRVILELEVDPALPDIECDAEQLKQVLLNLVINAAQATEDHGTVAISCRAFSGKLFIDVRDEGVGVPPEKLDMIFEPFFTTKESGTGLGLAVAANIIEQHGGHLTARHNNSRGMTFQIELPCEQSTRFRWQESFDDER